MLGANAELCRIASRLATAHEPHTADIQPVTAEFSFGAATGELGDLAIEEIHLRRSEEAGDKFIGRHVEQVHRRADLHDFTVLQHNDLVGERHRLDLVMRHINGGGIELAVEFGNLDTGIMTKRCIQVRQRFVKQEHIRVADNGTANGDALALAARERRRAPVQQMFHLQDFRSGFDAVPDLGL